MLPKSVAFKWASKAHSLDRVWKSEQLRWMRSNWRWLRYGSTTKACWSIITVRSCFQNRCFAVFWALSKCQFGDTHGDAACCAFLQYLVLWEDKLVAVQTDIR